MIQRTGRMFLISDLHFGKNSSNVEKWLPVMEDWAFNWFLPLVKKEAKRDDFLVIGGDLFDDQEIVHLHVKWVVEKFIRELSSILPVHIIEGNHDTLDGKDSSPQTPSATSSFNYYPNVFLHYSEHLLWNDKKLLLQGWIRDGELFKKTVTEKGGDILVCHSEVKGCIRGKRIPPKEDGINPSEVRFEKIYSGHIHIRHKVSNWLFVGSPYHLDMNDLDDTKGIWIISSDGKEQFIENDFSPKFLEFKIDNENDIYKIDESLVKKNWCDLHINTSIFESCKDKMTLSKILSLNWRRLYRYGYKIEELIKEGAEQNKTDQIFEMVSMDKYGLTKIATKKIEKIEDETIKNNLKNKLDHLLFLWETQKNELIN